MRTIYRIALLTATVGVISACGQSAHSESDDKVASSPEEKGAEERIEEKIEEKSEARLASPSENDHRIEAAFKSSHVCKTYLQDDDIQIKSKKGVVTLTGSVDDANRRQLAQHVAAALPGVMSVDNRIEGPTEAADENSNSAISSRVRTALFFQRNTHNRMTEVNTAEGVVTLSGEAASQAQKDLIGEYAEDVRGVTDVKNDMTVAEAPEEENQTVGEMIDDASITAQIRMALLFHRSTSALNTGVDTIDGVVTISGQAENAAEKNLVAKLIGDINGVKSLVNNMTIEKVAPKA